VADAIRSADAGGGVMVVADIGSAVLSVRAVLQDGMVEGTTAVLADAPMIEGTIAAAVTASIGGDLEAVRSAAEEAWNVRKL
jgi:dihydroxyacetone kinase DhaKLM complex PTS-EIIA-like component DhaM